MNNTPYENQKKETLVNDINYIPLEDITQGTVITEVNDAQKYQDINNCAINCNCQNHQMPIGIGAKVYGIAQDLKIKGEKIAEDFKNNFNGTLPEKKVNDVYLSDMSQFKTTPIFSICPNCNEVSFTKVKKVLSKENLACCCLFSTISWVVFQSVRGKDINCNDAEHYCSKCSALIAKYEAC